MSRCALFSAGADVFLADFVLSLWKKHWYDEIDTMYVYYNNHAEVPQYTVNEFLTKWDKDPKVRILYLPHGIGNGDQTTQLLYNCKEDLVLLLENDNFIFTPGVVDGWFKIIEFDIGHDIVGSPRFGTGEVADAAKVKYNLDYSGVGDKGFAWWPSFFVCRREDLLKTDLDFGSKKYPKDEYFKELDHTMEEDCYTDTFAWTSLQLRYMGLKSYDIPQNHAHPADLDFQRTHEIMFMDGDPKYIHAGSLSSGWGGYLNKTIPTLTTDMEKQDMETRVAFWELIHSVTTGYQDFRIDYHDKITDLIDNCNLDMNRIQRKIQLYRNLMHL